MAGNSMVEGSENFLEGATEGLRNFLLATGQIVAVAEGVSKAYLSSVGDFSAKVRELNPPKADTKSIAEPTLQDIQALTKDFLAAVRTLRARKDADEKAGNLTSTAVSKWPKAEALARDAQRIQEGVSGIAFVSEWAVVMLMTFFRAYLQDSLQVLAERKPDLVKENKFDWTMVWEVSSIEELRAEVRLNWADGKLDRHGPKKWFALLEDFGARDFSDGDIKIAQHLFDIRNRIVHSQGRPTPEYLRNYPDHPIEEGRIRVTLSSLKEGIGALGRLALTTEVFVLSYGKKGEPEHEILDGEKGVT